MKKNNITRKVDAAMTNMIAAFVSMLRICLSESRFTAAAFEEAWQKRGEET